MEEGYINAYKNGSNYLWNVPSAVFKSDDTTKTTGATYGDFEVYFDSTGFSLPPVFSAMPTAQGALSFNAWLLKDGKYVGVRLQLSRNGDWVRNASVHVYWSAIGHR